MYNNAAPALAPVALRGYVYAYANQKTLQEKCMGTKSAAKAEYY
jgi:hypothetical protein